LANAIRALAMDAVERAKSGHPGMPLGTAEIATVLFTRFLKFDPLAPHWADRDRFVLSAGHGSMLLYALLHLTGYPEITIEQLKNFRQLGARTAGHPEYGHAAGIEVTTGPLGQGLATAVGLALAERIKNARYGDALVDHYTYVLAGDGCLMEGLSHEAIDLAGHLGLSRLIVLWDDNQICIDGSTGLTTSTDQLKRFEAAGWSVRAVDGHDPEAIAAAIAAERATDRPSLIACRTVIGYGAPTKQGTAATHGSPLGAAEIEGARRALGWEAAPFELPEPILAAWRAAGARGREGRLAWEARLAAAPAEVAAALTATPADGAVDAAPLLAGLKQKFIADQAKLATRQSSQKVLEVLLPLVPQLLGGSADLTGSVGTKAGPLKAIARGAYDGRYLHYGVREHGMAAVMNGLALDGGIIPYGGTFLVFSDYSRPAIRLGALMGVRAIHVFTHDSIGLGEDGPTHQPVEHLAALRAIPNLLVLRPADAVETAEAWEIALAHPGTPTVLSLTRQALPLVRSDASENLSARGGYVLREAEGGERQVTLIATGSEVEIALEARALLAAEGVRAALVSLPAIALFKRQDAAYRAAVLGAAPRVAVEAALEQGWEGIIGDDGAFVGMTGFGASAPAEILYPHFGITPAAVAEAARRVIATRTERS